MVFYLALVQARLLCWFCPAQLWDWAASFHRAKVAWRLDDEKDPAATLAAVTNAAAPRSLSHLYEMPRQQQRPPSGKFVRMPGTHRHAHANATFMAFTPLMQFLDLVVLEAKPSPEGGTELIVTSMSSCCFPAWFPFGFVLGAALFWLPFPDTGANTRNLAALRRSIETSAAGISITDERVLEVGAGQGFRDSTLGRALGRVPSSLLFFCGYMLPTASIAMALLLHSSSLAAGPSKS